MKAITDTTDRLMATQYCYLRNFRKGLRKNSDEIIPGDQVYLQLDRKRDKKTRHKLAPIVDGPLTVTKVDYL